jgi:hypothetical protein
VTHSTRFAINLTIAFALVSAVSIRIGMTLELDSNACQPFAEVSRERVAVPLALWVDEPAREPELVRPVDVRAEWQRFDVVDPSWRWMQIEDMNRE